MDNGGIVGINPLTLELNPSPVSLAWRDFVMGI
jgi:hypothetical protein